MASIKKEDIILCAFNILKSSGIEHVNARAIAKELNTSVQPIFYQFENMNEVKEKLLNYALDYYKKYLLNFTDNLPKYKQVGLNYIGFAQNEANIFKFIFMGNYHIDINNFNDFDSSYSLVEEILEEYNDLSNEDAKNIHLKMWLFTHGIASLIATKTCCFSNSYISDLLTNEFNALIANAKRKEVKDEN